MARSVIQPSFGAGEIGPNLYGRVDLQKYSSALALLRNFFVDYRGGVNNRPGTAYLMRVKDSSVANRLIPFVYSIVQAYSLVFGHLTMRVIQNGGLVLETVANGATGPFTVATMGTNTLTTTAGSGWTVGGGDTFYVTGTGTQLDGGYFLTTSVAGVTVNFTDLDGNSVTPVGFTGAGTVSRVYTVATPYSATDLASLKFTQSADTMTLTHASYAPRQLTRTNHAAWTFTAVTFGAGLASPTSASATGSLTAGTTSYRYAITEVGGNGTTEGLPVYANTASNLKNMSVDGGYVNVNYATGDSKQTFFNVYRQREVRDSVAATGDLYGFVGQTTTGAFVDQNISPDFTRTPPTAANPFSGAGNYPSCVTYFNGRQVFAGTSTQPQGIWTSRTGDYLNMDFSSPGRDGDAIVASLISNQVNAINWLVPMNSLIAFTTNGAWKIDGGSISDSITPTAFNAVPQAYHGASATVPPVVVNYDIIYAQARGAAVRDLSYNFYANVYTGANISVLAAHLMEGHQIKEWCYAEEPYKVIWAVRDDGVLLSLTYVKEQEVVGWAHSDTQGQFLSICSIPEGSEDAIYCIVKRFVGNQYLQYIERFQSRVLNAVPEYDVPGDLDRCWFVDAGLRYPLTTPAATLYPPVQSSNPTLAVEGSPVIGAVVVVAGGSGYTAPTVVDFSGSGAVFSVTLSGGAIASVAVTAGGTVSAQPDLRITDATGSGAILSATVQRRATFTASAAVFSGANIGDTLRINRGIGTVLSAPTTSTIVVDLVEPCVNAWPQSAGAWSLTTPVTTVTGLGHLEGLTVSILADGSVEPQQAVSGGAVTLARAASSIVVGLPYTSRLKTLAIDVQEPGGTAQGKRKQIAALTVRMQDSRGIKFGPSFDRLTAFKERRTERMGQPVLPITGDLRQAMNPDWQEAGVICIETDDPLPATVLAVIPEIAVGDQP